MKTISIIVYTFDELSDKAKEVARDWLRQGGDLFDAEPTIEDAKNVFALMGFEIGKVFYSGFSSQGDGACFEGKWSATNAINALKETKEYAPQDAELHRIAKQIGEIAALFPSASLKVEHSGGYSHEFCTQFDISICDAEGDELDTPERTKEEKNLIELSRDAMRWIYRQLEKGYEWTYADEQIDETILANEYTFLANGKRFRN